MTEPAQHNGAEGPISEVYARANGLNAKLASGTDQGLIREARQVAQQITDHIRSRVENYDDFVKRVEVSEEYSLTESRQLEKTEKDMKVLYLRAASLLEAASEAEARARKKQKR